MIMIWFLEAGMRNSNSEDDTITHILANRNFFIYWKNIILITYNYFYIPTFWKNKKQTNKFI